MSSIYEDIFYYDEMDSMKKDLPKRAVCWTPLFDRQRSKLPLLYQHLIMIIDSFLRNDKIGFKDTHFVISNDPEKGKPSWKRIKGGYHIRLNNYIDENDITTDHIAEMTYNLGYLLMHCLIDHMNHDRNSWIPWAEEIICRASALAILQYIAENWEETSLAEDYPAMDLYASAAAEIRRQKNVPGKSSFLRCPDYQTLMALSRKSEEWDRADEISDLFWRIQPEDLPSLAEVRRRTNGQQMIHTKFWMSNHPESDAIRYICRLQERIPECILPDGKNECFNLIGRNATTGQISAYAKKIRALRDLPYESIVFDLASMDEPIKEKQLSFYQLCRDGDDMHIEVCFHDENGPSLYYKRVSIDDSVEMMKYILTRKGFPSMRGWTNWTEAVFGDRTPVHIRSRYEEREACPVCGRRTLTKANFWERCPVCYWQDDPSQRRDPDSRGSNGSLTLSKAKSIWDSGKKIYDTIKDEYALMA